jgi:hypothetical protein
VSQCADARGGPTRARADAGVSFCWNPFSFGARLQPAADARALLATLGYFSPTFTLTLRDTPDKVPHEPASAKGLLTPFAVAALVGSERCSGTRATTFREQRRTRLELRPQP